MKIIKNYLLVLSYQLINLIFPLITMPYLTRILKANNLGIYTYIATVVGYLCIGADLGMTVYGIRKTAYVRNNRVELSKLFMEIITLKTIVTLTLFVPFVVGMAIFKIEHYILYIIQSLYLVAIALDISWFYQGIENFKKSILRNIFVRIISIFAIFTLVKNEKDLIIYSIIIVGSIVLSNFSFWIGIKKYVDIDFNIKFKNIKEHLKNSMILFIPQVTIQIYALFDRVIIGNMLEKKYVSIYDMSDKLVKMGIILITAVGVVMMPNIANYFAENDMEKVKKNLEKSINMLTILAFPIMLGIIAISDNVVKILFPSEFSQVALLMKIMALTIIFWSWNNVTGSQILIPFGKEKAITKSVVIGAFISVSLNVFLIGRIGVMGAAISTFITEGVVTILQIISCKGYFKLNIETVFKSILAAVLMYLIIFKIENLFIQMVLGGVLYPLILFILREKIFLVEIGKVRSTIVSKIRKSNI